VTRQATVRYYADWDTGYTWDSGGNHRWGSIDQHLPVGDNNAHTSFYQPIIHFPIDTSYMVSVISAQVVVQVCDTAVHFGSFWGASPSWLIGRLSQAPPDHQNAGTVCGGGGWALDGPAYSPGWDAVSTWPSHNNGWAYGIDATVTVQALKAGYPNYGFMFAAYNPNQHRSEWRANDSGVVAYIDITYEVPNEAPYKPWGEAPGNASYGNNTQPLVRLANNGDIDGDPAGGVAIEYGVVNNYGDQSWAAGPGASGFDTNPARYVADFYPTLTRGKWHCFRGYFVDHHGASSGYSDPWWHYVWALPNAPSIVGGMQPIHNLGDLNQWSGNEGRPTVRITPSDPDGKAQTRIQFEISTNQATADWSGGYDGTFYSGGAYDFNIPFGLPNDLNRYIRAQTRDSEGNWGPFSAWTAIKVRWSQAIYQYHGTTFSGQYAFSLGKLNGSSPSAATIFRGATGAGGAGAGAWKASIGEVGQPEWMNVLVRLAIGRDTSSRTTLSDMSLTFLGAAQQPDEWVFSGLDEDFWQLDTSNRRYGTKSLKWTRQTPVATGLTAWAETDTNGDRYVVPVVKNTKYTLSVWVRGTLSHGAIRGVVRRDASPDPFVVAVTDPVTDTQGEWFRMRVTFTTDDATTEVSVGVAYDATADGLGDIFWVDAVQIEEGPVASTWNPGQTGAVIVDVGGISIDASRGASLRMRGSGGQLRDVVELSQHGLMLGGDTYLDSPGVGKVRASHLASGKPEVWLQTGANDAAIELRGNDGYAYIDFSPDNDSTDYNARLIAASGSGTGRTPLTLDAAGLKFGSALSNDLGSLDGYKEGAWTPDLQIDTSGGGCWGSDNGTWGRFTRIGNIVFCHGAISRHSGGMNAGTYVCLRGMPYALGAGAFYGNWASHGFTWGYPDNEYTGHFMTTYHSTAAIFLFQHVPTPPTAGWMVAVGPGYYQPGATYGMSVQFWYETYDAF
jgi:hypothetical protein